LPGILAGKDRQDVFASQGQELESSRKIARECGESLKGEKNNEAIKMRLRCREP